MAEQAERNLALPLVAPIGLAQPRATGEFISSERYDRQKDGAHQSRACKWLNDAQVSARRPQLAQL